MRYNPGRRVRIGGVEIDLQNVTTAGYGKQIDLTAREFAILEYFAVSPSTNRSW